MTFNPIDHGRDVKANPGKYVRMDNLIAIVTATAPLRAAKTLNELRDLFTEATRKHKGNDAMISDLMRAKDRRKEELEA